jgi:hypothetical protein
MLVYIVVTRIPSSINYERAQLGCTDGVLCFTGALRDVRLYARALPGDELAAIVTATKLFLSG